MPAFLSASKKSSPEPSIPGISLLSSSIKRLSNCNPDKTARRCSTVCASESFAPKEVRRILLIDSKRFRQSTFITGFWAKSKRVKFIPVFTSAGLNVRLTLLPVCKPIPEILTGPLIVFCIGSIYPVTSPIPPDAFSGLKLPHKAAAVSEGRHLLFWPHCAAWPDTRKQRYWRGQIWEPPPGGGLWRP